MASFKPIKITPEAYPALAAALAAVNGKASAHCYTTGEELFSLANKAEARLAALDLPKSARAGARWRETSGDSVANAYAKISRTRRATAVTLARRSADWYLVSASPVDVWKDGGGPGRLFLTQAQADEAVRRLRESFIVLPTTTEEA